MHQGVSYYAAHHILKGKDTGGARYSWPVSDQQMGHGKQDVVEASWVPMSEVVERRIVSAGKLTVMRKCWEKVLVDQELYARSLRRSRDSEPGATIGALLLGHESEMTSRRTMHRGRVTRSGLAASPRSIPSDA